MIEFEVPLLAAIVLLPLVGGLPIGRLDHRDRARVFAVAIAFITLVLACGAAWAVYARVGHGYVVDPGELALFGRPRPLFGIDGLSAALVVFDALVTFAILLAAPRGQLDPRAATAILLTEATTILAFVALDTWLLLLAWSMSLIPGFLELRRAASVAHVRAASRVYAIYLFGSALAFAVGVVLLTRLAIDSGVDSPLHIPALVHADLPRADSAPIVIALGTAVLLRAGLVPFHSWIPALFERVPPLVLVPTLLSQLGAYLLVRLIVVPLPGVLENLTPSVADLALVTAVYGAFLGLAQRDLRRAVGCLVMSQSALVFVGLECDNTEGVAGGLVLWLTIGTAMTGLALAVAAIHARVGPRQIDRFTGLAARAPWLAALFLVLGLSNVWLPGTLGFVGEDLLVHGVLATFPAVGISIILASAINGFNVLRAFTFVFLGPPAPDLPAVGQLLPRERLVLVGIVVLLALTGILPGPIVALRGAAAEQIADRHAAATGTAHSPP